MGQEGEVYLEGGMLMRQEANVPGVNGTGRQNTFLGGEGGLLMGQDG